MKTEIYGASHSEKVGVRITGIPEGMKIDMDRLQVFLDRRAPGKNPWSTSRKEDDKPVFISGLKADHPDTTDGNVLEAVIYNKDIRQEDYPEKVKVPRPGHADYPSWVKYGRIERGGGQFSGRMTAPLCIAGGIFLQWLEKFGIRIEGHIGSIGGIEDRSLIDASPEAIHIEGKDFPVIDDERGEEMKAIIAEISEEGDSIGGTIECRITGMPAGAGEPLFGNLESRICQAVFAVPAVKGIEFGNGFEAAELKGSENNDGYRLVDGKVITETNRHGGILGGITTGMPVIFKVAIKPTPSIAKMQRSVDLEKMTETNLEIKGRHDPCIVPRAVPCIEAAAAIAIWDVLTEEKTVNC